MNYHNFQRYKNGDIDIKKFYVVMLCKKLNKGDLI